MNLNSDSSDYDQNDQDEEQLGLEMQNSLGFNNTGGTNFS